MLQLTDPPRHKEAWERFLELGLPAKKEEVYRYVHLKDLYRHPFSLPSGNPSKISLENNRLVFINGSYRPELSQLPASVIALTLTQAKESYGSYLMPRLQKLTKEEKDPFALLNSACFDEALFLYLPPKCVCEAPIRIVHYQESLEMPALLCPRLHLFMGKNAATHLSFEHTSFPGHFTNSFLDLALEEGAQLTLTILSDQHEEAHDFLALRATLKGNALFNSFAITKGAATSRQDYRLRLQGEGANASLYGAWDVKGTKQHHVNVHMEHQQPHCTSLQKFKGVVREQARSSFEGKIYVHAEAQKTEAYQMNNNLILSDSASAYSKPNLEIFADDVKASHGSTVGQLQEEDLFYLRARGIKKAEAQELLIGAFVREIIELMEEPSLKQEALDLLS